MRRPNMYQPLIIWLTPTAVLLILFCFLLPITWCGPADECYIMQTTDPKTPCYISVNPQLQPEPIPTFVYAYNLPKATTVMPCPVVQTLDSRAACYLMPKTKDDPAYYLRVPLTPKADELDLSPEGLSKLREESKKPLGIASLSASATSEEQETPTTVQVDGDNFQLPSLEPETKTIKFNQIYGLPDA